jgi:Tfp pilus assembly protein PilO
MDIHTLRKQLESQSLNLSAEPINRQRLPVQATPESLLARVRRLQIRNNLSFEVFPELPQMLNNFTFEMLFSLATLPVRMKKSL